MTEERGDRASVVPSLEQYAAVNLSRYLADIARRLRDAAEQVEEMSRQATAPSVSGGYGFYVSYALSQVHNLLPSLPWSQAFADAALADQERGEK